MIEQTLRLFAWFYDTRGWFQEGLDTLGRAVDAMEASHGYSPYDGADKVGDYLADQVALGHLLTASSWLAYRLARYERAQAMLERSLEILRPLKADACAGRVAMLPWPDHGSDRQLCQGAAAVLRGGRRSVGRLAIDRTRRCASSFSTGSSRSPTQRRSLKTRTSAYSPPWRIAEALAIHAQPPLG